MKISSWEEFRQDRMNVLAMYPEYYKLEEIEKDLQNIGVRRYEALAKFPHGLVVEGDWVEMDVVVRWLWQRFGPMDGQCGQYCSEYPACPLVLETKYMLERPAHISEDDWEEEWHDGYRNPGEHSHEGTWTYCHYRKTGYDHGFGEYCFVNPGDRDALAAVVEGLGLGEKYDLKEDEQCPL